MNVYSSIIHNSQKVETTQMSINKISICLSVQWNIFQPYRRMKCWYKPHRWTLELFCKWSKPHYYMIPFMLQARIRKSAGTKDWRQEKGMTEGDLVGRHDQLDGHELEQALGVGDRQASLVCCSPWGHKQSHTTERLNWTDRDKQ